MEDNSDLVEQALNGSASAQNYLASRLIREAPSEQKEALFLYLNAVAQGYIEAMWNAGSMIIEGEGGVKDEALGFQLIKKAAEHKNSSACLFLANCYDRGLYGLEENSFLSSKWHDLAWETEELSDYTDPIDVSDYVSLNNFGSFQEQQWAKS